MILRVNFVWSLGVKSVLLQPFQFEIKKGFVSKSGGKNPQGDAPGARGTAGPEVTGMRCGCASAGGLVTSAERLGTLGGLEMGVR